MTDSIRLGRIAGVRVGLNWSLIVMVGLVASLLAQNRFAFDAPGYPSAAYAAAGAATAVALLLGVLFHELGHALAARAFGLQVDGITLSWMGGVTRIQGESPRPGAELVVAGIGPVVSAGLGGVLWVAANLASHGGPGSLLASSLGWLATINLALAVFNLLPAAPLDGGRVLHSAVWAVTGDRWRATRVSGAAGMVLGLAMVALGFVAVTRPQSSMDALFIGIIGWWILVSAKTETNVGAVHRALEGLRIGDIMRPVGAAPGWITVRAFAEGYAAGRPGWVWLLETWGGGYGGVILGDSLGSVPLPQWDLVRPLDLATPISATAGAAPGDDALDALRRMVGKQVLLVVEGGQTLGAVLPSDIQALVTTARRGPVPSRGWTLTRG